MATTIKTLGQSAPSATTATDLYTVPANISAVCSSIVICNRSTAATFRVSVRVAGAAAANKQYVFYDFAIAANDTVTATLGLTLATTDVVTVYASTANLSFNLFGEEIT